MSTAEEMARTELLKRASAARAARIALARMDSSEFNALVLKDERTGAAVEQAPIHHRWHECWRKRRLCLVAHESGRAAAHDWAYALDFGRDPNKRVVIVSNTAGQSSKMVRTICAVHREFTHK